MTETNELERFREAATLDEGLDEWLLSPEQVRDLTVEVLDDAKCEVGLASEGEARAGAYIAAGVRVDHLVHPVTGAVVRVVIDR